MCTWFSPRPLDGKGRESTFSLDTQNDDSYPQITPFLLPWSSSRRRLFPRIFFPHFPVQPVKIVPFHLQDLLFTLLALFRAPPNKPPRRFRSLGLFSAFPPSVYEDGSPQAAPITPRYIPEESISPLYCWSLSHLSRTKPFGNVILTGGSTLLLLATASSPEQRSFYETFFCSLPVYLTLLWF